MEMSQRSIFDIKFYWNYNFFFEKIAKNHFLGKIKFLDSLQKTILI